jgi:NADH dehydrogenase
MTVAVVGASGAIGRAAVAQLAGRDPEVRALVRRRDAADDLRHLGAKVAVGAMDDEGALEAVLAGAFTVVHLVGGVNEPDPEAYERSSLESVRWLVPAAATLGVRRIVLLSHPSASPSSDNPYLRAKGRAEDLIRASGIEHAIIRCSPTYGLGGTWFTAVVEAAAQDPPEVVGSGRQIFAPVLADDVGHLLAAIDDRAEAVEGTWGLDGPDVLTADEFAALVRGSARSPVRHLDIPEAASRLSELFGRNVSAAACEVFSMGGTAVGDDVPDAAATFGIVPTALVPGLRATMSRATAMGLEG